MIKDALSDSTGSKIVSIILGLGLSALFKRTCRGNNCVVVKGPGKEAVEGYYYKLEDDCYKYKPYAVKCEDDEKKAKSERS